jgi:phosphoenolpyruvate synthase/pyruvate phosphate dikinase
MQKDRKKSYVLWFEELSNQDVGLVGGKNASLGGILKTFGIL